MVGKIVRTCFSAQFATDTTSSGTVLVHLLAAVLRRQKKKDKGTNNNSSFSEAISTLPSLYITCTSPFQEVEEFVSDSIKRYNLRLVRQAGGMKEALERYLQNDSHEQEVSTDSTSHQNGSTRSIKAIFVGTRRTDPHGSTCRVALCSIAHPFPTDDLQPRIKTDPGWPEVERVHPILDWNYNDVWDFLRCPIFAVRQSDAQQFSWGAPYGVPYCSLYDEGYTSLGSTFNTFPNPVLDTRKGQPIKEEEDRFSHRWLPAYRLDDENQERAGRSSSRS